MIESSSYREAGPAVGGIRSLGDARRPQAKRDGERNEALDTFVYAHAARHGLISMGLRLNEEVEWVTSVPARRAAEAGRVIRSAWMGQRKPPDAFPAESLTANAAPPTKP
jgi:phage terminase large subunit GpA-like protein